MKVNNMHNKKEADIKSASFKLCLLISKLITFRPASDYIFR